MPLPPPSVAASPLMVLHASDASQHAPLTAVLSSRRRSTSVLRALLPAFLLPPAGCCGGYSCVCLQFAEGDNAASVTTSAPPLPPMTPRHRPTSAGRRAATAATCFHACRLPPSLPLPLPLALCSRPLDGCRVSLAACCSSERRRMPAVSRAAATHDRHLHCRVRARASTSRSLAALLASTEQVTAQ